jgi:hypothetical protein
MNSIFKLKYGLGVFLWIILNSFHSAFSKPIEQPVIVFVATDCTKAYLIRVFENGKIEYRGAYGVKTIGKHEAKINQKTVKALLKKLEEVGSFEVADDRTRLPFLTERNSEGVKEAIHFSKDNKTAVFFMVGGMSFKDTNPLFNTLRNEIFRVVNINQWLVYTNPTYCTNYDVIADDVINAKKLKLIKN